MPGDVEGRPLGRPSQTFLQCVKKRCFYLFLFFFWVHLPGVVADSVVPSW